MINRLVIDVLIPHDPDVLEYAKKLAELDGVEELTVRVVEIDDRTKTLEMSISGRDLSFEEVSKAIEEIGGSIHSIDEVSARSSGGSGDEGGR